MTTSTQRWDRNQIGDTCYKRDAPAFFSKVPEFGSLRPFQKHDLKSIINLLPGACYDRGIRFHLKRFLKCRAPWPQIVGNMPFLLHDSSCVHRLLWGFFIRCSTLFCPSKISSWEVLAAQIEETQKNSGAHLSTSRHHRIKNWIRYTTRTMANKSFFRIVLV